MAIKLKEHTYGTHIYMKIKLENGQIEELDVYLTESGEKYRTSADNGAWLDKTDEDRKRRENLRGEIISAFKELY